MQAGNPQEVVEILLKPILAKDYEQQLATLEHNIASTQKSIANSNEKINYILNKEANTKREMSELAKQAYNQNLKKITQESEYLKLLQSQAHAMQSHSASYKVQTDSIASRLGIGKSELIQQQAITREMEKQARILANEAGKVKAGTIAGRPGVSSTSTVNSNTSGASPVNSANISASLKGLTPALEEVSKKTKQVRKDFWDAMESGTTFGHKVGTTFQYMAAGAGIGAIAMGVREFTGAIIEADKAMGMFQAVLEMQAPQAKKLQEAVFSVGVTYGGTISELNDTALALGRAGIANEKLAEGIKSVSQLAMISGESLGTVTDVMVSWETLYSNSGYSLTQLGDIIVKVANESKASVADFNTMSTYILTAGQQAGLTAEALASMAGAWKQIGKGSSTSGTEIRRFFNQLETGSNDVRKAYDNLGISMDKLKVGLASLKPGESDATMVALFEHLSKVSDVEGQKAIEGIGAVLDKATIKSLLAIAKSGKDGLNEFKRILGESKDSTGAAEEAANKVALTYEKMWERIKNTMSSGSSTFADSFKDAFAGSESSLSDFNTKITDFESSYKSVMKGLGAVTGKMVEVIAISFEGWGKIFDYGKKIYDDFTESIIGSTDPVKNALQTLGVEIVALTSLMMKNPIFAALVTLGNVALVIKETSKIANDIANSSHVTTGKTNAMTNILKISDKVSAEDRLKKFKEYSSWANREMLAYQKELDYIANLGLVESGKYKSLNEKRIAEKQFKGRIEAKKQELDVYNKVIDDYSRSKAKVDTPLPNVNITGHTPPGDDKDARRLARERDKEARDARELELKLLEKATQEYFKKNSILEDISRKEYEGTIEATKKLAIYKKYSSQITGGMADYVDAQSNILKLQNDTTAKRYEESIVQQTKLETNKLELKYAKDVSEQSKIDLELQKAIIKAQGDYNKVKSTSKIKTKEELKADAEAEQVFITAIAEAKAKAAQQEVTLTVKQANEDNKLRLAFESTNNELNNRYESLLGIDDTLSKLQSLEIKHEEDKQKATAETTKILKERFNIQVDNTQTAEIAILADTEERLKRIRDIKIEQATIITNGPISEEQIKIIDAEIEALRIKSSMMNEQLDIAKQLLEIANKNKKLSEIDALFASTSVKAIFKNKTESMHKLAKVAEVTYQTQSAYNEADLSDSKKKGEAQVALINSYGALSGAIAGMFKEGSREAQAFQIIQSGLALTSAIAAVMNAGTSGDGYSAVARMMAVAATAASFLSQIGIALSGNSANAVSDYQAAHPDNMGTGSILGDVTAQSESIAKSLDILGTLAKPEFQLISSMNKSLLSIDSKIAGTAANILQAGGFATGAGGVYSATDSRFKQDLARWQSDVEGNKFIGMHTGANITDKLLGGQFAGMGGKVLGALTGANVSGYLMDKMFGGSSETMTIGAGITFNSQNLKSAMNNLVGQAFQTVLTQTDGGWFGEDSTSVYNTYQKLDDYTKTQFQLILKNLYTLTDLAGSSLGESVTGILDSMNISIGQISLMGKSGDEIQKQLEAVFSKIGDNMAATALPLLQPFQAVGEGMFETMMRVSAGMQEASYYINKLGVGFSQINYKDILDKQGNVAVQALTQSIIKLDEAIYGANNGVVDMLVNLTGTAEEIYTAYLMFGTLRTQLQAVGVSTSALTASMITGAGSIDILNNSLTAFIDNFLTVGDKFSYEADIIAAQFAAIGLSMPNTKQGFKDLVDMMDTTTSSGQELYGKLMALSEGFAAVTKAAEDTVGKYLDVFAKIDKILNPDTYESLLYLQGLVAKATIDNASSIIDRLQAARDAEVASLTKQMDSITSAVAAIAATVKTLRESIIGTTGAESSYKVVYNAIRDAIANNQDFSGMTTDLNSTAIKYADVLKSQAQTSQEYIFSVAQLANEIEALGATSQTVTLSTINTSIATIDATFKDLLTQLDANITSDFTLFLTENERYFGAQSLLIGRLTSVDDWMAQLYEVQAAARLADLAHISTSTFDAGHVLGTQEKVDIARATNLTVGTDAFNTMVTALQGFSTQTNDNSYLQQIAGVTAGSTTIVHPEILKAMDALSDALPQDALDALTWLKATLPTWAQTEYQNNLLATNAQRASLAAQVANAQQQAQQAAILSSTNTGDTAMYAAMISMQWASTANQLAGQLASIQDPILKTTFYADGGIVSNPTLGMVGEAGYPEAIIPMRNGKDIPVNMGGSFNELNNTIRELKAELVDLKNLTIKLVADNSKQLQTQRAMLAEQLA